MIGADEIESASEAVFGAVWETSTTIPNRFISRIASSPKLDKPFQRGARGLSCEPHESAKALLQVWVSVMYLTPRE